MLRNLSCIAIFLVCREIPLERRSHLHRGISGFAYDDRDPEQPHFYLSEDFVFGAIRRFTPTVVNETDPWSMLTGTGITEYLRLNPDPNDPTENTGSFSWTREIMLGRANAAQNYPESQGIDVSGATLAFVVQGLKQLFLLDLDTMEYKRTGTSMGLMDGEPNEIRYVTGSNNQRLLYMTESEQNTRQAGVHARTDAGVLYTVLEGLGDSHQPLSSGFALSPDGKHMYVAFKLDGLLYDITRDDGLSFFDPALDYEVTPK